MTTKETTKKTVLKVNKRFRATPIIELRCPCGWTLQRQHNGLYRCVSVDCKYTHKQYRPVKPLTITLEEV